MKDPFHMENPGASSSGGSSDASITTLTNSIQALGRGFDVTSDIRLLYCKGAAWSRLVYVDEDHGKDLVVGDGVVVPNVSVDIECSKDDRIIQRKRIPMSGYFNEKSGISGHVPLGSFNAMFNFTASWQIDAAGTKSLALIGNLIPLFTVKLAKLNLALREEVKRAIPYSWDPQSLASFIENFGTHIITSVTIGGRDVVYIRQHQSSPLSVSDIDNYVKDIGEQRYGDSKGQSGTGPLKYKDKDVTVIFRRRGGDDLEQSHTRWAETVKSAPDVINMTFTPIVSLLEGVPGIKQLARAIDLYMEYKPPIEDLQYFLDFQIARVWAPEQSNLQRKEPVCPSATPSISSENPSTPLGRPHGNRCTQMARSRRARQSLVRSNQMEKLLPCKNSTNRAHRNLHRRPLWHPHCNRSSAWCLGFWLQKRITP